MKLSEYLTESILSKKKGIYSHRNFTEKELIDALASQAYPEVTTELDSYLTEYEVIRNIAKLARNHKRCSWAKYVDDIGERTVYFAGLDGKVCQITFSPFGALTVGWLYIVNGGLITVYSKDIEDSISYIDELVFSKPW
jgi:hypothetical protein